MARDFDGTDDRLRFLLGGLDNFNYGTFAAILRKDDNSGNDAWLGLTTSVNTRRMSFGCTSVTGLFRMTDSAATTSDAPTLALLAADGWAVVAGRKASGSAAPRFSRYLYSTAAWAHENGATALADFTALGAGGLGELANSTSGSYANIQIAVVGMWNNIELTDTQVETLAVSLMRWHSLAPTALWVLDQGVVSDLATDLTGNGSSQVERIGTAVGTQSVPGFSYGSPVLYSVEDPSAAPSYGGGQLLLGVG